MDDKSPGKWTKEQEPSKERSGALSDINNAERPVCRRLSNFRRENGDRGLRYSGRTFETSYTLRLKTKFSAKSNKLDIMYLEEHEIQNQQFIRFTDIVT